MDVTYLAFDRAVTEHRLANSCRNKFNTRASVLHKPPKTHFVRSGKPICAPRLPGEEPSTSHTEVLNEDTDTAGLPSVGHLEEVSYKTHNNYYNTNNTSTCKMLSVFHFKRSDCVDNSKCKTR